MQPSQRAREFQWQVLVIEDGVGEVPDFRDKGLFVAVDPARGRVGTDARVVRDLYPILPWDGIDEDLARVADDFAGIVVSVRGGAGMVEAGDLAAPELNHTNCIVSIFGLFKFPVQRRNARGPKSFGLGILAEEGDGKVNVVDGRVNKDASAGLQVHFHERTGVELLAAMGAEYDGGTDEARLDFLQCLTVILVKSPGIPHHKLRGRIQVRPLNHICKLVDTVSHLVSQSEPGS